MTIDRRPDSCRHSMQDHYIENGEKHCSECDELPKPPSIEHVVVRNTDDGAHEFECMRCKHTYRPALPCSIDMFTTMGDQFVKEHANCPELEATT